VDALSDDEAMQRASSPISDEAHCSNDVNANADDRRRRSVSFSANPCLTLAPREQSCCHTLGNDPPERMTMPNVCGDLTATAVSP
jgi:hypothetical protein